MIKTFILAIGVIFTSCIAMAQEGYPVSSVSKELLPYASVLIRDSEESIEVKALDNTVYKVKKAITVFNKNGDDMAGVYLYYDKSRVIKNVKGIIYNEFGKQMGKFSEGDFIDESTWDGFSLFTDTRIKYYLPHAMEYPYTIAYEYEYKLKQTLNFPDWQPVENVGMAVEKSKYTFTCSADFSIRYKETNMPSTVVLGHGPNGARTYTWTVNNLKALRSEPYSPNPENYLSTVMIVPEKFSYYNITGSFTNWQELGKWNYDKLLASRRALPPATVEFVKGLTKDIADPKLKAKKIYEYMQGKTHYVSVQIGIGGYQPFLASDVDQQNYGDCKALVNYTQALLSAVGVESYYCVVEASNSRKVSLLPDFASMEQGNHIILCLPFKNDTTWADCTSQTLPFGYLGDFTDDRYVLACTPEGGKLMHTPRYPAKDNTETRKADFIINSDGELSGSMITTFKGLQYENRDQVIEGSQTERLKEIPRIYPINNLEIEQLEYKQDKSFDPATTERIKLKARDYGSMSDGTFYFMLNAANRTIRPLRSLRNRLNDVCIQHGYTDNDEIKYTLPAGYHFERTPLDIAIDKPFGKFKASMKISGNQLVYKRELQLIDGTYSKDTYVDLVDFYQSVADADGYTVALKKTP